MNIIIAGAGKVGETLIEQLSGEDHDVVVIDRNAKLIERLVNSYDILGISGNAASYDVQMEAGVDSADVFIALTQTATSLIFSPVLLRKKQALSTQLQECATPITASSSVFSKMNWD